MFKKLFIRLISLILITSTLFASSELFMKKKIHIEDGFRGMGLDPALYKIWIGTRDDANMNSKYQIKKKNNNSKKQYIPGLPTIPSAPKTISTPSSSYNESYVVYVYIDNSYDTNEHRNTMETIIKTDIWPALNHCDDCVQFKSLSFLKKNKSSNGFSDDAGLSAAEDAAKAIETKLIELQDANIALERTNELNQYALAEQEKALLDQQFTDLEEQLQLLQEKNNTKEGELEEVKNFRLAYLEEQYKMQSMFKDSLLIRYGQKLDNIYDKREGCRDSRANNYNPDANADCENCCDYPEDSVLSIEGCIDPDALNYNKRFTKNCQDCCKYLGCMDPDALNYDSRATDATVCEYSESNVTIFILIGLIAVLIILSILSIIGNKKKVVYLKPKNNTTKKTDNEDNVNASHTSQAPAPPATPPTAAPIDEGVLQSEIQTQRQSAVAMSAGQKEGATQILKDWLDESKNDEENSEG